MQVELNLSNGLQIQINFLLFQFSIYRRIANPAERQSQKMIIEVWLVKLNYSWQLI